MQKYIIVLAVFLVACQVSRADPTAEHQDDVVKQGIDTSRDAAHSLVDQGMKVVGDAYEHAKGVAGDVRARAGKAVGETVDKVQAALAGPTPDPEPVAPSSK